MLILFVCLFFFFSVRFSVLCLFYVVGLSQFSGEEHGVTINYKADADDQKTSAVRVFAVATTDIDRKETTLCVCTAGAFPSVASDRFICVKTFEKVEGTMS